MNSIPGMPPGARVWIYQSDRGISPAEKKQILEKAGVFLADWTSHGAMMQAGIDVLHDHFLVVAADEEKAKASGCGIDKSVRFVRETGQELGIDFFDRMNVAYRDNTGKIAVMKLPDFEKAVENGIVSADTIVFNNLISTAGDLERSWEVPLRDSWHARMLVH
ncbi:MAG TPA: ABC transporter ATPase [Bacteroidia bacterium]|nr:ABC transporter ATPase [Bacteroidia bacterium]